jgi:hypothetical protein
MDRDFVVVDTTKKQDQIPNWDIYKNDQFALRRRCVDKFLKIMEKQIV